MAWVVATCLLIDVAEADPRFGVASARLLDRQRADGLVICPVNDVELANRDRPPTPAPPGKRGPPTCHSR